MATCDPRLCGLVEVCSCLPRALRADGPGPSPARCFEAGFADRRSNNPPLKTRQRDFGTYLYPVPRIVRPLSLPLKPSPSSSPLFLCCCCRLASPGSAQARFRIRDFTSRQVTESSQHLICFGVGRLHDFSVCQGCRVRVGSQTSNGFFESGLIHEGFPSRRSPCSTRARTARTCSGGT